MQVPRSILDTLPVPDDESAEHSARVAEYLRGLIAEKGGRIPFAEYMHHVLYARGLGYYVAGARKFGDAGDFVTAPEVSSLFSRVVGAQVAAVLEQLEPAARNVLEIGAGSGVLAADLLQKLSEIGAQPECYSILEISPELVERQRRTIVDRVPQVADRVVWLSDMPAGFSGAVIANELLDAFPVERFVIREDGIRRLCVGVGDAGFAWVDEVAPEAVADAVRAIERSVGCELPCGYVSELPLAAEGWIGDLARAIVRGFVFLFDYGVSEREYFAPDRHDGWLRCHYRHRAHADPLILPGIQDLSHWVNFTAVARAARRQDLQVAGYVTQGQFLLHAGLDRELPQMGEMPTAAQIELAQRVKVLTMPGEMGEHIKCLGLSRGGIDAPSGFGADRAFAL